MRRSHFAPLLALALASSAPRAEDEGTRFAERVAYPLASGRQAGVANGDGPVHTTEIIVPGAPSLRVFFEHITLGEHDHLDVISPLDGNVHRLDRVEVAKWEASSGYFNGDTLLLELWVEPGSTAEYRVSHLLVGVHGVTGEDTICDADDRVASTDNRAVRMLNSSGTGACSGWLAGPDDCTFSAGHCFPGYTNAAEVNCPPSSGSGALQHPPLEDQFPVDGTTLDWTNGGLGNDWAVCKLLPNNLGESASQKWGYYGLGYFYPTSGETIRITGFGTDSGVTNQVNQTDSGPYDSTSGTSIRYVVDTTGGSSGSPVIYEASDIAIGIHTNGGCFGSGGSNSGTSLLNTALQAAHEDTCVTEPPAQPVASFSFSDDSVVQYADVKFLDTSTGVPNSWEWDFDEDGSVDSNLKSPAWAYTQPGTYDVELMVSNAIGSDTTTTTDAVTVTPASPVSLPHGEGFTAGLPGGASWIFQSDNDFGVIEATSSDSPGSGGLALAMSSSGSGVYATNEAIMIVDGGGHSSLIVEYWIKETGDEGDFEDGLWVSDGTSEALVQSHASLSSSWTNYSVDAMTAANAAGLDTSGVILLIFRQRDDFELGTDGHLIDDIEVTASALLSVDTVLIFGASGGVANFNINAGPAFAGEPYLMLGSITGFSPGFLVEGVLIPLVIDFYTTYTLVNANQLPLVSNLGTLDAQGRASAAFAVAPGSIPFAGALHHACIAGDLSFDGDVVVTPSVLFLLF